MERLDIYELKPSGMEQYLSMYGWHFSKKMCEWAVSKMKDRNNIKAVLVDKQKIETQLSQKGYKIDTEGYDVVYVYMMAKCDFGGHSLPNEDYILKFVYDYFNDKDGYDTVAFTRFYADTIAKGSPIMWEDMI